MRIPIAAPNSIDTLKKETTAINVTVGYLGVYFTSLYMGTLLNLFCFNCRITLKVDIFNLHWEKYFKWNIYLINLITSSIIQANLTKFLVFSMS
jgi:hypothetical protein